MNTKRTLKTILKPTQDAIATFAYSLYEARGAEHGGDQLDWFTAERRLTELANKRPRRKRA